MFKIFRIFIALKMILRGYDHLTDHRKSPPYTEHFRQNVINKF